MCCVSVYQLLGLHCLAALLALRGALESYRRHYFQALRPLGADHVAARISESANHYRIMIVQEAYNNTHMTQNGREDRK